ncbi:MAG: DedA family protein [Chthoniobacteraceae bacterium]
MNDFLLHYGLLAVFLCATVETDVSFIFTGVAIHTGAVPAVPAFLLMLLGALAHDTLWFSGGRYRSEAIRDSRVYQKVGPVVERLVARFGAGELFLSRFIYGTRNPSLLFWGVQHLAWGKYLAIEVLALTLWGALLAWLGYSMSGRAEALVGEIKSAEKWLLIALVSAGAVFLSLRHTMRALIARRVRRSAEAQGVTGN